MMARFECEARMHVGWEQECEQLVVRGGDILLLNRNIHPTRLNGCS
jgi:hypothetical protein